MDTKIDTSEWACWCRNTIGDDVCHILNVDDKYCLIKWEDMESEPIAVSVEFVKKFASPAP